MDQISTFSELDDFLTKLHDCPFDIERTSFEKKSGAWRGTFLRPLWDDPQSEHTGLPFFYIRSRLPVTEVNLMIGGVENVEVIDDQRIGLYSFNEIQFRSNGLRLLFNEALRIDLQLSGAIRVEYYERRLPGYWAIYRQFLLVQSGPDIERLTEEPRV